MINFSLVAYFTDGVTGLSYHSGIIFSQIFPLIAYRARSSAQILHAFDTYTQVSQDL